jgi:hypothetical protein
MLGIYRVAAQVVASRAVLSSTELVSYTYIYVYIVSILTLLFCKHLYTHQFVLQ